MKKGRILLSYLVVLLVCAGFLSSQAAMAADAKTAPQKIAQKKQAGFVASKDSDKYHKESCPMAANIKPENKITFATKAEAEKAGYKPCGVCFKAKASKTTPKPAAKA